MRFLPPLLETLLVICTICVVVVTAMLVFEAAVSSGPHCPGKDPEWLGFCDDAPEAD